MAVLRRICRRRMPPGIICSSDDGVKAMPMYEYKCKACGREYEELVPFSATEHPPCPNCNSGDVERKISACASTGLLCGTSGFS
jgi:putative FmdB family regulatory protein